MEGLSMTTIFTPPDGCSTSYTYEGSYYNSVSGGLLIQNDLTVDSRCFPSGFTNSGRADGAQVYSPGWCAAGYTSVNLNFAGTATTAICCPSDFSYTSTLTTPNGFHDQTQIFAGCISTFPAASQTVVPARVNNLDITTSTVTGPVTLWAQPITVAYNSDQMKLFTTSTPSPSTTPSTTTSTPFPTEPLDTATATSFPDSGLSTGAKAGIGVGAAVAVLVLIGLAFFLVRRSRQAKGGPGGAAGNMAQQQQQPLNELEAPKKYVPMNEAEGDYFAPAEMPAPVPPREPVQMERQELPG